MSELVIRKIADHFARQWGGGGFMGWVIRDPRIIRWGGRGGFLDPRGSVIRGPPTTLISFFLPSVGDEYKTHSSRLSSIALPVPDVQQILHGGSLLHLLR